MCDFDPKSCLNYHNSRKGPQTLSPENSSSGLKIILEGQFALNTKSPYIHLFCFHLQWFGISISLVGDVEGVKYKLANAITIKEHFEVRFLYSLTCNIKPLYDQWWRERPIFDTGKNSLI